MTVVLIEGTDEGRGPRWCPFWVEQRRLLLDQVVDSPDKRPDLRLETAEFYHEHGISTPLQLYQRRAVMLCEKYPNAAEV